jgi:hypothetical protein
MLPSEHEATYDVNQLGYDGFIFDIDDVGGPVDLMGHVSSCSDVRPNKMSRASHSLSER